MIPLSLSARAYIKMWSVLSVPRCIFGLVSAMSTPAKRVSFSPLRRKSTTIKTSLDSPFKHEWPEISSQNFRDIKAALTSGLIDVRPPSRREIKEGKDVNYNKEKRSQLILGVNTVVRYMEQGRTKIGLVCDSAPPSMQQHCLALAANKGVAFGILPELNSLLCPLLGMKSVLAIGIKNSDLAEHHFPELIASLQKLLPIPKIPWVKEDDTTTPFTTPVTKQTTPVSKITGTAVEDEATLASLNQRGNKRSKATEYYSLNVKRLKVTPNSKNKKKM